METEILGSLGQVGVLVAFLWAAIRKIGPWLTAERTRDRESFERALERILTNDRERTDRILVELDQIADVCRTHIATRVSGRIPPRD